MLRPVIFAAGFFALPLAVIGLTSGSPANAAAAPRVVLADGTVRYDYGRGPAPVLICKPRYVCDITLDSGENVLNMAIGDASRWVIAGGQSGPSGAVPHVFVKPTQPALETNIMITTTKRIYNVALRSSNDAKAARISFYYADEDTAAKALLAERQRSAIDSVLAGTPQVNPNQGDAKYKLSGETALTPDKVFNDGVRTFVQWKTLPAELPTVVAVAKDGSAQPLNFRVVGSAYIVDSLIPDFDLVTNAGAGRHGRDERRVSIRHL